MRCVNTTNDLAILPFRHTLNVADLALRDSCDKFCRILCNLLDWDGLWCRRLTAQLLNVYAECPNDVGGIPGLCSHVFVSSLYWVGDFTTSSLTDDIYRFALQLFLSVACHIIKRRAVRRQVPIGTELRSACHATAVNTKIQTRITYTLLHVYE